MKDPIPGEEGRELFMQFAQAARGRSVDAVLSACINMVANCIRQNYGRRSAAEAKMQELYGKNMEILLEHYDSVSGHRRSVIPFDQVIRPTMLVDEDVFPSVGNGKLR